ncbi:MAG TPA: LuxR C-terminal-related transcriptional regulator [Pyrinomonadaceae bacterium]|nr:LuxR C-terminal-related transcriptional regulator [Pyrinomonadaceae bacterium]
MVAQEAQITAKAGSETYPLGEPHEPLADGQSMALVALSHTPVEHRLYTSMLAETAAQGNRISLFSTKQLMALTSIRSSGTVRRGLEGLIVKLSIERQGDGRNGNGDTRRQYLVRDPKEILVQRNAMGVSAFPAKAGFKEGDQYLERALKRVVANNNLSRREAQVALCCVEGLTNAEIGNRLSVGEQTVKFHLRHVFVKFGVRRRAELISRLLM